MFVSLNDINLYFLSDPKYFFSEVLKQDKSTEMV